MVKTCPRARGQAEPMTKTAFLRLEWSLSLALVALALGWAALRDLPLGAHLAGGPPALAAGVAAGASLWLCIPLLRLSAGMRRLWDDLLAPFSRSLSRRDIVVIALLSGVSEELFFRGILLPELGLVASSVLFGLLHALTPLYGAWATLTGAGFGLLALYGGSLLTPIAAHTVYNLGALLALRHWDARAAAPEGGTSP
jgi:membrane protease YdiL (CAAX protease family)